MNESKIRIEQYEQAADRVSLNGIKWERKWDVRIQCDSREEADRVRDALTNLERQEQEPVAWLTPGQDLHLVNYEGFQDWIPLYTIRDIEALLKEKNHG